MLNLIERVRGDEDGSPIGRGLAKERANLRLEKRIEAGRGLVEDDEIRAVHERLHDADLLAVPLRELADWTVEIQVETRAELVAQPLVDASTQACQRGELLAAGESIGEPKIARQVTDATPRGGAVTVDVTPEKRRASCGRVDQPEEQADRRRLPGAVRPEVAEDLGVADLEVEIDESRKRAGVRLREPGGFDGKPALHGAILEKCQESLSDLLEGLRTLPT